MVNTRLYDVPSTYVSFLVSDLKEQNLSGMDALADSLAALGLKA